MDINLSIICPDASMTVVEVTNDDLIHAKIIREGLAGNPAACFVAKPQYDRLGRLVGLMNVNHKEPHYTIVIHLEASRAIYKNSWIKNIITFEMLKTGLMIHEAAHIRYTDFSMPRQLENNKIYAVVNNILEDAMIEYRLSLDFPEYSKYFTFLLSSIKDTISQPASVARNNKSAVDIADKVKERVGEVYSLARYESITGKDDEFTSKILPLIVSSKRSDSFGSHIASTIISNLILKQLTDEELESIRQNQKQGEFEDDDDIFDEAADKVKAAISSIKVKVESMSNKKIKQLAESMDEESQQEFERQKEAISVKAGDTKIEVEHHNRTKFFIETARKRKKQIDLIRGIFMKAFTERVMIEASDGDLNIAKQQQAYMNSITMETGLDYQYSKVKKVLLDVVIMRDISGSTGCFSTEYAEAVVVLLSALENIGGIRTAEVDFGPCNDERKSFNQSVSECGIEPVSTGGTAIAPALRRVSNYEFKGKRNIVFIISDGDIYDKSEADKYEKQLVGNEVVISKIAIGGYKQSGYKTMTIEEMPKAMAEILLKEVLSC